jgi:flavin-dependent dehydrogenase
MRRSASSDLSAAVKSQFVIPSASGARSITPEIVARCPPCTSAMLRTWNTELALAFGAIVARHDNHHAIVRVPTQKAVSLAFAAIAISASVAIHQGMRGPPIVLSSTSFPAIPPCGAPFVPVQPHYNHRVRSCDAVVIGAGAAGSAAARLLAGWGHDVVVLHRPAGLVATLAESIPPSCRKLFAALGVLDRIDAAGFYRSRGNTVWWGTDEPREECFTDAPGYQVERDAFNAVMREAACAQGAVFRKIAARDVRRDEDGACVLLTDDSELNTRFVLDCSGRTGVVARRGWRVDLPDHPRTIALVGVWTRANEWSTVDPTHTLVESYADGWAWSVPMSPHIRYITAMVDPRRTELVRGRPAFDVYNAELRKARHLRALTAEAALERGPWGYDASVYVARQYAGDTMLLVGDAGSFIDPLSSYGIKKALASAWLAAVSVHSALRTPSITTAALDFFSAREQIVASALIDQTRSYFDQVAAHQMNPFWTDRATVIDLAAPLEPDVRALREHPQVHSAFDRLKTLSALNLRRGASLRIEPRPVIRGHEIVLEDRLFSHTLEHGARYLRDVDLSALLTLAPDYSQVPELFEAYCRTCPPVALPDFLGALSVMLAFDLLEHSPATTG